MVLMRSGGFFTAFWLVYIHYERSGVCKWFWVGGYGGCLNYSAGMLTAPVLPTVEGIFSNLHTPRALRCMYNPVQGAGTNREYGQNLLQFHASETLCPP